ncbi:MAG: hypothetical protein AABX01_07440 [Candidatus Micrarchaeota archaeon]
MPRIEMLEKEVKKIKERNASVETEKAWETSHSRRALLMAFTYLAIGAYLQAVSIPEPWLNALVPTAAFMLSTLTLPFIKKLWIKHIYRK